MSVSTPNLPTTAAVADLVGNADGPGGRMQTARISIGDLATQLLADGPIKTAIAEKIPITYVAATWAALSVITGSVAGVGASVIDADTGTHTDPVAGGTVANAGVYTWSTAPVGWKRIGANHLTPATDAEAVAGTATDRVMTPHADKAALEAKVGDQTALPLPPETGFVEAHVDEDDQLAYGVKSDGTFVATLSPDASVPFAALGDDITDSSGWAEVHTDQEGTIAYGVRTDGKFWARLADDAVIPGGILDALFASLNIIPSSDVAWVGDSLTAGAGGGGTTAPGVLAAALGRDVYNGGIGGQTSTQISARFDGTPITVTLTGNQIPASGGVAVTAKSVNVLYDSGSYAGSMACVIAGVPGTMTTDSSGNWTFTRASAGSVVAVPAGSKCTPTLMASLEKRTVVLWLGRNNASATDTIISDALAVIDRLTPTAPRVLVLSIINGNGETTGSGAWSNITATNTKLSRIFGGNYIDVRRYLIDYGLAEAGITPTSQDTTDVAGDTVPASLRYDGIHLNAAGYTVVGNLIAKALRARGW